MHKDASFLVLLPFLSYFLQPAQLGALPGWDPEGDGACLAHGHLHHVHTAVFGFA